jgi:hypothetical protein
LGSIIEQRFQMAFADERVSVRHLVCCATLFKGRFTRFTRFKAAVSQGSIREFSTTLGDDRGAKAAADDGSKTVGIIPVDMMAKKE